MPGMENCDGPVRVESAVPVFSTAAAQIQCADYLLGRSPVAAVAEQQSLPEATLTVRRLRDLRLSRVGCNFVSMRTLPVRSSCDYYISMQQLFCRTTAALPNPDVFGCCTQQRFALGYRAIVSTRARTPSQFIDGMGE